MQFLFSLRGRRASSSFLLVGLFLVAACGDDDTTADTSSSSSGTTASSSSSGATTSASSAATTASATASATSSATGVVGGCLDDHAAGDRFSAGDNCNFCDCNADGSTTCTTRTCAAMPEGCEYGGSMHAYGEHFPSTDGCNECVCAASGLACTRRDCTTVEEGAILVESLDTPCGTDPAFTAAAVLAGLPFNDFTAPFAYETDRPFYPESLPDTEVRVRIVYDGGFAVCRIPNPGQEAFDIEVLFELITADGAFDEGFHTFLRRNASGFNVDYTVGVGVPAGGLDGGYQPSCLDPAGFTMGTTIDPDGVASGHVTKVCETDIPLDVGTFVYP